MSGKRWGVVGTVILLLGAGIAGAANASEWPQIRERILARYASYFDDIKDLVIDQEMMSVTAEGTLTAEMTLWQKGKKFRSETVVHMPEMAPARGPITTTIIFDGRDAWMISPMTGRNKLPPQESMAYQKDRVWWEFLSERATVTGKETIGGRECVVVEVEPEAPGKSPFSKIWLEENTFVLLKMESRGSHNESIMTEFSEFQKVAGNWEMPYKTTMYANGELMATMFVTALAVNTGIADDMFDAAAVPLQKKGFPLGNMMKEIMKGR